MLHAALTPPPHLPTPYCPLAGDGAANQGQVYEAANMAKLWDVPAILVCENNQYGMGTSTKRSSANDDYYRQGGVAIPGVQADGMDYLAAREAWKLTKAHAGGGKGPIYLEFKTYRYHGHSMSDPGITYRDRDEVAGMRASKDCIEQTKARLLGVGWVTEDELKEMEKEIRAKVSAEVAEAAKGSMPELEGLYEDIFYRVRARRLGTRRRAGGLGGGGAAAACVLALRRLGAPVTAASRAHAMHAPPPRPPARLHAPPAPGPAGEAQVHPRRHV